MRSCISRGSAVSGGCCRRTFLRLLPCRAISTTGETTACLRRSILSCCCKRVKRRAAERGPRRGGFAKDGRGAGRGKGENSGGGRVIKKKKKEEGARRP